MQALAGGHQAPAKAQSAHADTAACAGSAVIARASGGQPSSLVPPFSWEPGFLGLRFQLGFSLGYDRTKIRTKPALDSAYWRCRASPRGLPCGPRPFRISGKRRSICPSVIVDAYWRRAFSFSPCKRECVVVFLEAVLLASRGFTSVPVGPAHPARMNPAPTIASANPAIITLRLRRPPNRGAPMSVRFSFWDSQFPVASLATKRCLRPLIAPFPDNRNDCRLAGVPLVGRAAGLPIIQRRYVRERLRRHRLQSDLAQASGRIDAQCISVLLMCDPTVASTIVPFASVMR